MTLNEHIAQLICLRDCKPELGDKKLTLFARDGHLDEAYPGYEVEVFTNVTDPKDPRPELQINYCTKGCPSDT